MSYSTLESEEQERKLFVGGLNKVATDEEKIRSFFIKYGDIIDCTIMRDSDKNSRGFGFVLFENSTSVDEIINDKKNGKSFLLDDHHIEVKRALPKVPGGTAGSSRTGGLHRKIFVGGLPSSIQEDDLRNHFEYFGRVKEIEILRDRDTNRLRGFAFVTFDDEDSADKCIQRRTHEICKKLCEVKRAQTRSNIKHDEDDYRGGSGGRYNNRDRDERHHQSHQQQPTSLGINEVNQLIQQAFLMGQQSVMNAGYTNQIADCSSLYNLNPVTQTSSLMPISNESIQLDQSYSIECKKYYKRKDDSYEYRSKSRHGRRTRWDHSESEPTKQIIYEEYLTNGASQPPTAASLLNQLNPAPYAPSATANPLLQALMNQQANQAQPVQTPIAPQAAAMQQPTPVPANNTNQLANQIAQLLQGRGQMDQSALNALIKPDDNRQAQGTKPATNGSYSTSYPTSSTYDMYYNQTSTNSNNYGPVKDDQDSKRYRPY